MANKKGPTTGLGARGVKPEYQFGTSEDLANRNNTGYRSGKSPTTKNSSFTQIQPAISGIDACRPPLPNRSGNLKFSDDPS